MKMDGMNDMGAGSAEQGLETPPITPTISNEQCVPLEALAMPEEGDQLANPEVGDVVSYQVEGKVTRVEGDMAYVEAESINGKPVEKNEAPPEQNGEDTAYKALEDQANETGYLG